MGTSPNKTFSILIALIIDDSGHRKSGNFTAGVGRQYIGEIGKTDNGVVVVTTHLYDGVKSLPLDIALYQKADSFPKGKKDPEFVKKPDLAMSLVEQCLSRGHQPEIVLIDGGYGNNTSFLNQLEKRSLTYIGGLAKNRKVIIKKQDDIKEEIRLDKLAESIPQKAFNLVQLSTKNAREVWVATLEVEISRMSGQKTIAIVMNAKSFSEATDINYYITNREDKYVTPEWIYSTYSQRNWVEVFYREAKGWLGLREYQVRDKISLKRHFILVFCAYTFIIWHQLTGGIRRRWANKPLNTFTDTLEAFRTAISYRFVEWLDEKIDVFTAHKESLGFVWA